MAEIEVGALTGQCPHRRIGTQAEWARGVAALHYGRGPHQTQKTLPAIDNLTGY